MKVWVNSKPSICIHCKYCKIEVFGYSLGKYVCKRYWSKNYINNVISYEPCKKYNDDGRCGKYEPKLIIKIINKIKNLFK